MITFAVAMRAFTTALLSSSKKDYDKIREELHGLRAELGFERERGDSARGVMSFNERQKEDLMHRIEITREDLIILEAAEGEEGATEAGEEREDPKMPKHMRPRGEDLFDR